MYFLWDFFLIMLCMFILKNPRFNKHGFCRKTPLDSRKAHALASESIDVSPICWGQGETGRTSSVGEYGLDTMAQWTCYQHLPRPHPRDVGACRGLIRITALIGSRRNEIKEMEPPVLSPTWSKTRVHDSAPNREPHSPCSRRSEQETEWEATGVTPRKSFSANRRSGE